jgi:hypothetical protein
MKQASIKCPHCGSRFTVRQVDVDEIPPEQVAKMWAAADAGFKAMDEVFRKFFTPLFRK